MKIVSYNIQYTLGRDNHYDLDRVVEDIKGADIIALQEVDRYWSRSGNIDQPAEIAARLPQYYWVYGANCDMHAHGLPALDGENAERVDNRRRQFGTMILSKTPILSSRNFPLPKYGTLTQHSIQQGILEAVIDTGLGAVRFYSVHLSHLHPSTRLPQIECILDLHRRAFAEGGAWCGGHPNPDAGWLEGGEPPATPHAVIMGDFNCDCRSAEYAAMVGELSPTFGRLNRRDGFVDAWVAAGHAEDSGETYPNTDCRIDYCFVTPSLAAKIRNCYIDNDAEGSDHFPVWVEADW